MSLKCECENPDVEIIGKLNCEQTIAHQGHVWVSKEDRKQYYCDGV